MLTAVVGGALAAPLLPGANAAPVGQIQLQVLSGRADLVSGGSALVQAILPPGAQTLKVTSSGRDVTPVFGIGPGGKLEGLVTGLKLGPNRIEATANGARGSQLVLTDHPIGGPIFSGPQILPWACQAGARDKQCDQSTTYSFSYLPAGTGSLKLGASGVASVSTFQPYDPKNPPPAAFIATTTTDTGVTVPFIVRSETGYLDRDQFAVATLFQPGKPWTPVHPQPQFNRKLVLTHGASCDTTYGTGAAPSVLDPALLGHGYVLASHALDNAGHNCSLTTQAESLIMTKEHVIKTYGDLLWTIGSGCSGGSLVQQQVANAYPGVYQAITPQCSFTDAWSSAMEYEDYYMLLQYFTNPGRWSPGTIWTPTQISAVIDHPNIGNPITFTSVIPNSGNPSRSCPSVPAGRTYNPTTNPGGVKCTLQDYMVNVFGKRPDGFANRPFDNVGIEYGLDGLRTGQLNAAQFVDLNTHLGGLDYNGNIQPSRTAADLVALDRAYTSGAVDSANNLDQVAIIDLRGPDPGAFHDVYRTYAMRDRLLRDFGTAANQVLWRGQAPIIGDVTYADAAVLAADKWVARYTADTRPVPLAQKIREDKPGDLADRCTDGLGHDVPFEICDATVAAYGTPRFAADEPKTDDVLKCQLKPLRRDDFPVTFTSSQWAALRRAFPTGVCNYAAPGVDQHGATPWLTYQSDTGSVIYGGRPLGPAPTSTAP
ncbi:MAG TPA: DUF6351 family protein [Acidimicrobiales bacterium]|nr:DUF6351 family protein [Acidimicrobiales bacterium]